MRVVNTGRIGRYCVALLALLLLAAGASGQNAVAIVSAASFTPGVAPDSLASAFGTDLSIETGVAQFDGDGQLPLNLHGVSVTVAGMPAGLLFVSPGQLNFLVPPGAPLGQVDVAINGPLGITNTTMAVAAIAPTLFYVEALRSDRGALLNGSNFLEEPFSGATEISGDHVIDTRISLFGSGWRNSSPNEVRVYAEDKLGGRTLLDVEYASVAPGFAGLDQINVHMPQELRHVGLLRLIVETGGRESNAVSVVMNEALEWKGQLPTLVGYAQVPGDSEIQLVAPSDVAWARDGAIYIADPGAHSVLRLSPAGVLSRFAGTGVSGNGGDGGDAASASLMDPVAVDTDQRGNVYIVDRAANRVRVVDRDEVIRGFAGNGTASAGGDGHAATSAGLNGPSDVLVLEDGRVLIADTENHQVRVVTSDSVIEVLGGNGQQGTGTVWGQSLCAMLSRPTSLAEGVDGSVFVVDSGSRQIFRLLPNGQITVIG